MITDHYFYNMKHSTKKTQITEVMNNLKTGVIYCNERAGYSYSYGQAMIKICANGKLVMYSSIEKMAKAIIKSLNTGI